LIFLMVLFPVIIGFALFSINRESNEIKEDRIVQCETLALIGAVTIGQFLEKAIEEGGLSTAGDITPGGGKDRKR